MSNMYKGWRTTESVGLAPSLAYSVTGYSIDFGEDILAQSLMYSDICSFMSSSSDKYQGSKKSGY